MTDKMILSMLQIDGALYDPMMMDDMQMIEVEISDLQRTINPARVKDKLNSHALITVTRTYSSGARAMNGDLMYAENRTVSAQCSVAVLPDRKNQIKYKLLNEFTSLRDHDITAHHCRIFLNGFKSKQPT